MSENRSTYEAQDRGAYTAHLIHSAVKTGKAVSGAARGAAAGPYGAVAGLLLENRHGLWKAVCAAIALLMIPLLFIAMLPAIIFGGLADAFSPADPGTPILNSETAVVETAEQTSEAIRAVLQEALQATISEIHADFERSGADRL